MVGPSSSHTAGAARLGNIARRICGTDFNQLDFYLHGSFAKTYRGHGTDKALLGGVLGMSAWDEGIRESFKRADELGIKYFFHTTDLGNVHPNTVRIVMQGENINPCELTGSSIGGGNVKVTRINNLEIEFTGQYPTIITKHQDKPGIVSKVTSILSRNGINIAFLKVFRQSRGSLASMVIEADQQVEKLILDELRAVHDIEKILFVDID